MERSRTGSIRKIEADLNLVPFIDLLSVCITFLIATAVWVELASVPVDQAVSDGRSTPTDDGPPLTVHLRSDGFGVGRDGITVLGPGDWLGVEDALRIDRAGHPDEDQVVVVTDDGVAYRHVIHALDLTRLHGYGRPVLGGTGAVAETRGP
jgi:biopolymer transport protein ExbD